MTRDRLGEGRHRLGPVGEERLQVTIPLRQAAALIKLRIIRGWHKSEVVTVALDLALSLPPEEMAKRIEERREPPL